MPQTAQSSRPNFDLGSAAIGGSSGQIQGAASSQRQNQANF